MGSICWYCCSEPKEVGAELVRRRLRGRTDDDDNQEGPQLPNGMPVSELKMEDTNFMENPHLEKEYDEENERYRRLQEEQLLVPPNLVNYEQVEYKPYHWMRKVRTEVRQQYSFVRMHDQTSLFCSLCPFFPCCCFSIIIVMKERRLSLPVTKRCIGVF